MVDGLFSTVLDSAAKPFSPIICYVVIILRSFLILFEGKVFCNSKTNSFLNYYEGKKSEVFRKAFLSERGFFQKLILA